MAASTYPPPPPFYKLYKGFANNAESAPAPPPPVVGTYAMFGSNYTTNDSMPNLEEQGLQQLYPKGSNVDYKKELRALNRELCLQFLELADVLVERPSHYARRVEDMGLILRNMHHLLNSLRPHQARATVIHLLETQMLRRKQAVADIRRKREEVHQMLQESLQSLDNQTDETIQDAGMGPGPLDPANMTGQTNAMRGYGYGPDQGY